MAKLKVLVIDDDAIALEVAGERLRGAGYAVVLRDEALGTTRVVREEMPDIVLLDLMMPALNGERIVELLQGTAATREVAVVLHSSKSGDELSTILGETNAAGAITKTSSDTDFVQQFNLVVASLGLAK